MLEAYLPQPDNRIPALSTTPVAIIHFDDFIDKPPLMSHLITLNIIPKYSQKVKSCFWQKILFIQNTSYSLHNMIKISHKIHKEAKIINLSFDSNWINILLKLKNKLFYFMKIATAPLLQLNIEPIIHFFRISTRRIMIF